MGIYYRTEKYNKIPVFEIDGRISGEDAIKISRKLEDFAGEPFRDIIIDLGNIDFIDSNWLGVFAHCLRVYKERRKRVIFVAKSEFVKKLLIRSNIHRIATLVSSFEEI